MQPRTRVTLTFLFVVGLLCYFDLAEVAVPQVATPPKAAVAITADQRQFFESKIRPVLEKNCFGCHSAQAKEIEGGLLLDSPAGVKRGGETGPIIVAKNPDQSRLIQAIRYSNKDLQMPPDDSGGKLPDAVIHDFETWVKMGAPDPRDDSAVAITKAYDTTEARKWWSFQPLKRPDLPTIKNTDWARSDSDRFVLAGLEAKDLTPVGDADKNTLIRRVYFDLIGLPPTPAEVEAFVKNDSPTALTSVVDDLLGRREFGEHWGRHWLDVARYGESTGKDFNVTFPDAWRYRDYVVASFNSDKPYNQFVREQLAGDLMPTSDAKKKAELLTATGFLAVGPKSLDEMTPRQFDLDVADEQVDATSQAFIGLTVSCARCHDHKFDPILQTDYYAMDGIFLSTRTCYGTIAGPKNNQESELVELPGAANLPTVEKNLTPADRQKLEKDLADATAEYNQLLASRPGLAQRAGGAPRGARAAARQGLAAQQAQQQAAQQQAAQQQQNGANVVQLGVQIRLALGKKSQLENELNSYDASGRPKAFCMGVQDRPASNGPPPPMLPMQVGQVNNALLKRMPSGFETIADSPLFFRGEMSDPRERVPRGIPAFLSWSGSTNIPRTQSGRRELADWIVSPKNPLAARVMANRIWYWLYGQGIVASVDNFGTMGDAPSNQPLLDYLANRLMDDNWSIKKMVREIVLSHAYQLASTYDQTDFTADPQNALIWRHSERRLNAECIRDAMLASSGQLDLTPQIGSPVALVGDASVGAGPVYERTNDQAFIGITGTYRSLYLPVIRDAIPDSLAVFDYPDSGTVTGAREITNVPSQALYLLNNDFVRMQARQLANRLMTAFPPPGGRRGRGTELASLSDRVDMAFMLTMGRRADASEQQAAAAFFSRMGGDTQVFPIGAWQDFCLGLFNTAEFRYLK